MNERFLVKTLVRYFGEVTTIKLLNQIQKPAINKKAKRYKARIKSELWSGRKFTPKIEKNCGA